MSLQIWLPLTKDLRQQGVSNVTVTNNGATFNSAGKLGGCYIFDGADDAISIGNLSALVETNFSFACWFYHSDTWSTKSYETILGGPSGFELEAKNGSSNSPVIKAYSWGGGSFTYELNKWNHLVMTRTSSETKFYLNGELKLTGTAGSIPSGDYFVGAWKTSTSQNYKGSICDVRIYDHCLSPMEVKYISQGLACHYPLNGKNNSLVPFGYQQLEYIESTGDSYFNTNCYFNPEIDSCKVDFQGTDTQNNGMILANSSAPYFWLYYYRAGSRITIYAENGSGQENTGSSVPQDLIRHVVEYKNKNYYVDGNKYGSLTKTYTKNTAGTLWLFSYGGNNYVFKGKIYYVSIVRNGKNERIFIPAKRNSDSVVGMYDLIYNTFYPSESSTPFTAGPIVSSPTTIYDTSGFVNNGTVTGNLTTLTDTPKYQASIHMPTAATISHPRCIDNTSQEWTCAAWVKPDAAGNYQNLNNFNESNRLYHGTYPLLYLNSGTNDYYNYGNLALPANQWSHIVFVFKNSTGTKLIYVNGENRTNTGGPNKTSTPKGIPDTVIIGGSYAGYMCDYREYATALSAEDVKQLYNSNRL